MVFPNWGQTFIFILIPHPLHPITLTTSFSLSSKCSPTWTGKTAQPVKVLVAQAWRPEFSPRIPCKGEGENWFHKAALWPHTRCISYPLPCTYTQNNNKYNYKIKPITSIPWWIPSEDLSSLSFDWTETHLGKPSSSYVQETVRLQWLWLHRWRMNSLYDGIWGAVKSKRGRLTGRNRWLGPCPPGSSLPWPCPVCPWFSASSLSSTQFFSSTGSHDSHVLLKHMGPKDHGWNPLNSWAKTNPFSIKLSLSSILDTVITSQLIIYKSFSLKT